MGTFFYPITLIGPSGEETLDALVDTNLLFAVIPARVLERLGIVAGERQRRGERIARVRAVMNDEQGWAMCVFGPDGEPPRIGRHTLDSFLLDIDEQGLLLPKVFQEVRHF